MRHPIASFGSIFLAPFLTVLCATSIHAATVTNVGAEWPQVPVVQSFDLNALRIKTDKADIRNQKSNQARIVCQSFQVTKTLKVKSIYLSALGFDPNGADFTVEFYSLGEVSSDKPIDWSTSPDDKVGRTITVRTKPAAAYGPLNLRIDLDENEEVILPPGDGVVGYFIAITTQGSSTVPAFGWLHSHTDRDLFPAGRLNGSHIKFQAFPNNDFGFAIVGAPTSEKK